MDQSEELLSHLLPEDRGQLGELSKIIQEFFSLRGYDAWYQLDNLLKQLFSSLSLDRMISRLPAPKKYHRISLLPPCQHMDVVLLIFIAPNKSGEVVLINTYDSHDPNDIIYSADSLKNTISVKNGTTIFQTPIHNHKCICHSYTALIKNNSRVYEQFYKRVDKEQLLLIKDEERTLYDSGLDDSIGEKIHSISVEFF